MSDGESKARREDGLRGLGGSSARGVRQFWPIEVAEGVRQGGGLRMEILSRGLPESQKACKACLPGSPTLPGAETGRTAVPSLCVGWSESTTMLCAPDKKCGAAPCRAQAGSSWCPPRAGSQTWPPTDGLCGHFHQHSGSSCCCCCC